MSASHQLLFDSILQGVGNIQEDGLLARNKDCVFDKQAWRICGDLGLCGLTVPENLGGQGLDPNSAVTAMEALGRGCADNGLAFAIGAHLWGCLTMLMAGDRDHHGALIQELAKGRKIGALAVTESGAGSDVSGIETTAVPIDGGYRLDGHKIFVTNAPVADVLVVLATTDRTNSAFGHSAFCVERGAVGLEVSESVEKMGMRTAAMGEVTLSNCVVPLANRIGGEGAGLALFLKAMEAERAFILAPAIGAMERVFERTTEFAKARQQFGQSIAEFESIYGRLAEMYRRITLARLMLSETSAQKTAGKSIALEAAMTKLTISEAWVANCQDALAIYAGKGYLSETGIERELRDAHGSQIYSGTAEIQRNTVARLLKILP